jgi:hypothetical protein
MGVDSFGKMLDDWETSRDRNRKALDNDELTHRKILALVPEFWESIVGPVRKRFNTFNQRVGEDHAFSVTSEGDYHLEAIKESYPKAVFTMGINPDFPMLSYSGNNGMRKFYKSYFLRLDDTNIYLEAANKDESLQKKHVPLKNLESEALLPFLASVLTSIK